MSSDSFHELAMKVMELSVSYEKRFEVVFRRLELPYRSFVFHLGYQFGDSMPDYPLEDDGRPVRIPHETVAVDSMEGLSKLLADFMHEVELKFKVTYDFLDIPYEQPDIAISLPSDRLANFIDTKGPDYGSMMHRDLHSIPDPATSESMIGSLSLNSPTREVSSPFSRNASPTPEESTTRQTPSRQSPSRQTPTRRTPTGQTPTKLTLSGHKKLSRQ